MLEKVHGYIKSYNLIEKGDRILIAVSGGADSVCLLHILSDLYRDSDVSLYAVHVHHGIRDEEADRDEAFVKSLCDRLKITFTSYHFDVRAIAKKEGLSEEEAGRKVRYETFLSASIKNRCNKVAIAHNKNDNAETILFNLFRGTGIKGLTGIDPKLTMKTDTGNITIIRPILFVTRKEIEDYLSQHGLHYQVDSTNMQNIYTRNKIRHRILDYVVNEINKNAIEHITNAANHLKEADNFIEKYTKDRYTAIVKEYENFFEYDVKDFSFEDIVIQKGIVRKILGSLAGRLKDIEAKHVDEVLALGKKEVGRQIHLPYGIIAVKTYDTIKIYLTNSQKKCKDITFKPVDIKIPGKTYLEAYKLYFETEIKNYKKNEPIPKNSCMKWFDYDKIENTLKLRTRKAGDYLQINSQGGRKKLKEYFIDSKIPKEERDQILLLVDGSHVVWIIGHGNRISEKYKIKDQTKKILSIKLNFDDINNCKGEE
ncbi:tRNA lysidine(34) synthetase TilS [Herbinix luporum]|jgi:tRNA(Ile)-lysidine synthase|uniref:tRNA(Ile)-lysidine synthase n=1 Tax=Herbinix luporum TaxID=1679721 RepID=A0A0K8J314_9FIRM|nr:tRNA lysidine(34) synthetase TilS [Herbinix luporum]MDI9489451.1 tRNA lysidine(34) synthetase TilS [Bacillota bacterium]CUH91744.1 hypothetical protein SD1D_0191 [Herbinix luporum]HHT56042.1 tRNA lysidine(34) synthetase TilS [Herbinix luporum]